MTIPSSPSRWAAAAALIGALSACSSTALKPEPVPVPSLAEMLGKAGDAAGAGQKEQAVTLWKAAALAYPADKTAWSQVAATRFEAGQYGEAIIDAQEVLVRDPNDKQASSIIAASAIRLATRALADLGRQKAVSGALQKESQDLARVLRVSLGRDDDADKGGKEREARPRARPPEVVKARTKARAEAECTADNPLCLLLK